MPDDTRPPPPLEVLDIIVVHGGETIRIIRQKLIAEFPARTVATACDVIKAYVEMGLRRGGK